MTTTSASALPIGIPPARTLCGGGGFGGGTVAAYFDPARDLDGTTTIWIRPEFTFVPTVPGGYCSVDVTLYWRNNDTGVIGTAAASPVSVGDNTAASENTDGQWVPITIDAGHGRLEVLLATNFLHVPGKGTFIDV
ncbi:hypothetical protein AB0B25_14450 [Nocardia sp. NPDC049190]|uniref:hypothetical protein n=1 Tax=Nocardia sp. NPDC049190 TaxID=3155650 RepID=UPI0033CB296D